MTQFLSIKDISKYLNIPKRSAYHLAKSGILPGAFRIGRHWRFRKDMLDEWVEEQTKPQTTVKAQDI